MHALTISLRMLRRDWRAGELRVLMIAVMIAVASVVAVDAFTDRVRLALESQANELLGGDLVVVSSEPVSAAYRDEARAQGLAVADAVSFPSMALANGYSQLGEIKAVSDAYPLRGRLFTAPRLFEFGTPATGVPAPGTVWVEPRLFNELRVAVGDDIALGNIRLTIAAVLTREPGRAGDVFTIGPRILMNIADLERTGLIQPASRVRYRVLVAGEHRAVARYRVFSDKQLGPGERLEGVEDARPEVRTALERARRFLGLAALVSVVLAGVAVATSARRYVARHLDNCAIMRCVGATHGTIMRIYTAQILVLGLVGSSAGCAIGYGAQMVLTDILGGLANIELPAPSLWPAVFGISTGMITLLGFALPPLLRLKQIPALRVLRRDAGDREAGNTVAYVLGVTALAVLILWQIGDLKLGIYVTLGIVTAFIVLAAVASLLVRLLRRLQPRGGVTWRFGVGGIARRAQASRLQIVACGLGILVLLLLTLVRNDLLRDWQARLPADAPNRFIINILPDQVEPVRQFFADAGQPAPQLFPMVRGRIEKINDRAVIASDYDDERAQRLVARDFNLSWTDRLQEGNKIAIGEWWGASGNGEHWLSVEEGIAKTLGIQIGDTLTYGIAGNVLTAKVVNLRSVEWDSFRVNFFVVTPPGVMEAYPATYITAFHLPRENQQFLNALVRAFPNATVIDVAEILAQVRLIVDRVTQAVRYVFLFTVIAGLLVLYAAIQSTLDERIRENAILRTLGASRRQLLKGLQLEFVVLGLLAGTVAALAATVIGYLLATRVFELGYTLNIWLWPAGLIGGMIGIGSVGYLGTRFVLNQPPLQTLRGL
ncbi:MAG: hypothetical protein FD165_2402 [Gammaproteobacteria bacterium]|nr:MAG: hypothetical protein FD165_2402 [Gammaproteobacteria bacterium]TND00999.1 MAG: hypothetical protein FD120_2694 [Gammaproteobacteria bacterium]